VAAEAQAFRQPSVHSSSGDGGGSSRHTKVEGAGAHIDICLGAKGGRHSGRHAGVEALLDLHGGISSSGRGISRSAWRPGNLRRVLCSRVPQPCNPTAFSGRAGCSFLLR
jgi:hypothetical protein